ncbi:MAG: EcsC family protein [Pedobacter sp.]|nr:MAG: EcsC family protein [Pedobacter sp.]
MMAYEDKIQIELEFWKRDMLKKPSAFDRITNQFQNKINSYIPDKIHDAVTVAIKTMVKGVLYGSTYTTSEIPHPETSLMHREALIREKIDFYAKTSAAEGGITGAGGFLLSMADFPILIAIKIKLLFEVAAIYGHDVKDFKERLYILYIFQLAFSSSEGKSKIFHHIDDWENKTAILPDNAENLDWKTFQQDYRDYIDIAKLAQLLPVVGAAVGAIANYNLLKKLGKTATMAYRIRRPEFRP